MERWDIFLAEFATQRVPVALDSVALPIGSEFDGHYAWCAARPRLAFNSKTNLITMPATLTKLSSRPLLARRLSSPLQPYLVYRRSHPCRYLSVISRSASSSPQQVWAAWRQYWPSHSQMIILAGHPAVTWHRRNQVVVARLGRRLSNSAVLSVSATSSITGTTLIL